ncbi:MAG: PQQ-dependent sugar dehydrogenase [Oleiphilaceae bacterium]|nr:PQQ-dependent sugar dehydrogenase [Oleiphilaceae bacterium]
MQMRSVAVFVALMVMVSPVNASPRATVVLDGLGVPWGMTWWDKQTVLITERGGALLRWHQPDNRLERVSGLPRVGVQGQGGLLDVRAYPPQHWQQGPAQWLYITYTKQVADGFTTVLARARLDKLQLQDWQDLLVTRAVSDGGRHFGSRIAFDQQGHVYFGVGDRGERDWAQDLTNHAGSVLRLKLDGSVPDDNPFVSRAGALPEIYSYGHRNPQGLVYDEQTGRLWLMEHGPRGGDELNLVLPGRNYGWPVISYGKEYWAPLAVGEATSKPGMEQPAYYYDPSIAPGSLLLYRGSRISAWQGSLLAGALKLTHINQLKLHATQAKVLREQRWFEDQRERVRSLLEDAAGRVYFGTDSGRIYLVDGAK